MIIGSQTMERFIEKNLPTLLNRRDELMKKYACYVAFPEFVDDARPTDIDDIKRGVKEIKQVESQIGYMHKSCPDAAPNPRHLPHAGRYFDIPDCFECGGDGRIERGHWICNECGNWIADA